MMASRPVKVLNCVIRTSSCHYNIFSRTVEKYASNRTALRTSTEGGIQILEGLF